jgi:hypothetical protein
MSIQSGILVGIWQRSGWYAIEELQANVRRAFDAIATRFVRDVAVLCTGAIDLHFATVKPMLL